MALIDAVMIAAHLFFAAIWVGSVAFMTVAVLPLARDGNLDRQPLDALVGRTLWFARVGAALTLISGTHLMGTRGDYYDFDVLLSTRSGQAVLAMILLWLAMIGLVEVGSRRIRSGLAANLVREPSRDGLQWYYTATLIGILLFIDGGLLAVGMIP